MQLDFEREVAALQQMPTGQLSERYAELFGEQTRSRHRTYLIRKIAWKLQTAAEGVGQGPVTDLHDDRARLRIRLHRSHHLDQLLLGVKFDGFCTADLLVLGGE